MKACQHCGTEIPPKPRGGARKFCSPSCRSAAWVSANREKLNANVRAYRKRRYEAEGRWRETSPKAQETSVWYAQAKNQPCHDCGSSFPACCMDFDHREGEAKSYNVGSMVAHHYAIDLILAEVAKCDLVCANCHRIRTRDRRIGSGRRAAV